MTTPTTDFFLEEVAASLPPGISLPPAFVSALRWTEENGCIHAYTRSDGHYATLYPASPTESDTSCVSFHAVSPGDAAAWMGKGVPGAERLAPFIRTGGDGSQAALWLDPEDRLRFVHLGSGSGSTWAGVITDDPVEMLRFLAIGYPEPCWPDVFDATPVEVYEDRDLDDEAPFAPPRLFQQWLTTTFDVTIPIRGCDIVPCAPDMHDAENTDPFLVWLRAVQSR